jgi:L-ascorbate metabolism protein UlaG (beta-lactamase superfamily)
MQHSGDVSNLAEGITWLGHATVRVEIDGIAVLTDPVLRAGIGPVRRAALHPDPQTWEGIDLVVISHLHHDHLDVASLRLLGLDTPLVVPAGAGRFVERFGFRAVTELAEGDTMSFGPLSITATHAAHSGFRPLGGPKASALGYVIAGSHSVYFAGDTGLFPEMAALPPVDIALLPVGGWGPTLRGGHMDAESAVEALRLIRPRLAVPVHWGTFWPIGLWGIRPRRFSGPGAEFAARAAETTPEVDVRVLVPGGPVRDLSLFTG